jgi:LysM repeat protein
VVSSITDLERLTPYFLTVGKTVALDWGWVNSNAKSYNEMFNGQDPFITFDEIEGFKVKQEIFNNPQFKIQSSGGDYDALAGKISNFETTLRQDGGFDCVTTITAIGSALFAKPIDKPANQIQYESTNVEVEGEEKKRVKVANDSDNIINAIINLKNIILKDSFGFTEKGRFTKDSNLLWQQSRSSLYDVKKPYGLNHLYADAKGYGFAVDNHNNPNVIWMTHPEIGDLAGKEHFFVKWGWFEDQLLNRYISVKGGKDNEVKMTIRSIDTVLDENTNLPKRMSEIDIEETLERYNQPEEIEKKAEQLYKQNEGNLPGKYTVQPNDTLSGIATKLTQSSGGTVTVADLLLYNELEIDDVIRPGQELQYFGSDEEVENWVFGDDNPEVNAMYVEAEELRLRNVEEEDELDELLLHLEGARNLNELNLGQFLKTPTLIKNSEKFLKPKNPFKFFSRELLPPIDDFPKTFQNKAFKNFWNSFSGNLIKDKSFTKNTDKNFGRLRYMWVNIREIQTAFGVTFNSDGEKPSNVNPPGTLENGMKNLLNQLNRNFYDFWNFELTVDTYDPSNIKVIDKKVVDISQNSIAYTKFEPNSHKVSNLGIYKFPSFKVGSIVKNQNLSFKIPDSMAVTILYGSNKKDKKNESSNQHNNPEIMKMFSTDTPPDNSSVDVWTDRYLADLKSANIPSGETFGLVDVGSQNVNHNSRIVEGQGLAIKPDKRWEKWTGDNKTESIPQKKYEQPRTKFEIVNDNLIFMKEETEEVEKTTTAIRPGTGNSVVPIQTTTRKDIVTVRKENAKFIPANADPDKPSLYNITDKDLQIISEVEKVLRNRLSGGSVIGETDTIKVDTLIPADLTLEVDGIGGLVPGDICQTEYILPKYNVNFVKGEIEYGPFTYFQIVGINQKVDSTSWTTELTTKMRINHIPDIQDLKIEESEIQRTDKTVDSPPTRPSIPVPIDDEDIADDVTLDDLDFDDFENWSVPLPAVPTVNPGVTKILETGTVSIPTKSQTFGKGSTGTLEEFIATENLRKNTSNQIFLPRLSKKDGVAYGRNFIQEGSTYSNLQLGNQGFKLNIEAYEEEPRVRIPVPTDDEDIAGDVTLDDLDFDDFKNWKEPPQGPIRRDTTDGPVEKREVIEEKNPKSIKKPKERGEQKSTYRGDYWQNDKYLYSNEYYGKPEWRPIFEFQDGFRASFDRFPFDHPTRPLEAAVKTIRKDQLYSVRKAYWDREIEGPNAKGKSVLDHDGGDRRAGAILGARYR